MDGRKKNKDALDVPFKGVKKAKVAPIFQINLKINLS